MILLGNVWGLLALLAIPAVLAIHLFRRRFAPRVATGLFLYGSAVLAPAAGRQRERIANRRSLWLELLACLAAAWWLTDPHPADRETGTHLMLLLDSRLRLQAVAVDGVTAEQRARQAAETALAALGEHDRVTVVASGAPPTLLVGPDASPEAALAALATWHADRPWHDLDAGLALALGLGGSGAQTVVISDREPLGVPASVGFRAVGAARTTAGLADARWLRDAAGERLALRLLAQGGTAERRLRITHGERVLADEALELRDGESLLRTLALPAGLPDAARLSVLLIGDDPCLSDDAVELLRPEPRIVGARLALADPDVTDAVRRALTATGVARESTAAEVAHLLIGEGALIPGTWQLSLVAGSAPAAFGPFLARRGDALLAELDATGLLWSGGATTAGDGEALLVSGDAVLLVGRRSGRDRRLQLAVAPTTSNLLAHPWWPGFIANLVSARRAALPGLADPNLPCGQAALVSLPPGVTAVEVLAPNGLRARLRSDETGTVLLPGLDVPGDHRLVLDGQNTTWLTLRALALDARQADLRLASAATRAAQPAGNAAVERRRSPAAHLLPLLLLAGALLAAWTSFRREESGLPC